MDIYDITQEVFSCAVYPGDPSPSRTILSRIKDGAVCNLTAFSMCAHNGTHLDAPYHFFEGGKTIDQIAMDHFIGYAYVAAFDGNLTGRNARDIIDTARAADPRSAERILIKGNATVTEEAAEVFAESAIKLFGNESQTVGPENAPMDVHRIMLGAEIVLLEGIRLHAVPDGVYFLHAAPLNLGGADGSPCRATLIKQASQDG